jgi:hypothetical protein
VSADRDAEPLADARAFYDFVAGVGEPASVTFDATPATRSLVTLESESVGFFSAIFSLHGSASCSRSAVFGAQRIRLRGVQPRDGHWDWENDYAAVDRSPQPGWYRTQRIQLLDVAGQLVFGWTRDSAP